MTKRTTKAPRYPCYIVLNRYEKVSIVIIIWCEKQVSRLFNDWGDRFLGDGRKMREKCERGGNKL